MGLEGNRKGGVIDRTEEGSQVRRERVGGEREEEATADAVVHVCTP